MTMRPNPYRRPTTPQSRRAEMMRAAALRKRAVDRDFIDALGRAQRLLSEAASTLAMAASTPEQHDFVKDCQLAVSQADRLIAEGYSLDSPF